MASAAELTVRVYPRQPTRATSSQPIRTQHSGAASTSRIPREISDIARAADREWGLTTSLELKLRGSIADSSS